MSDSLYSMAQSGVKRFSKGKPESCLKNKKWIWINKNIICPLLCPNVRAYNKIEVLQVGTRRFSKWVKRNQAADLEKQSSLAKFAN